MYPKSMMIGMNTKIRDNVLKSFATIFTHTNHLVDIIQTVFVQRVYPNVLKIKCPVGYIDAITINQLPFKTAIISLIQPVFGCLHKSINAFGFIGRNGDSDSSVISI